MTVEGISVASPASVGFPGSRSWTVLVSNAGWISRHTAVGPLVPVTRIWLRLRLSAAGVLQTGDYCRVHLLVFHEQTNRLIVASYGGRSRKKSWFVSCRLRPLLEAQTIRRGPRQGERSAKLRSNTQERLRRLGQERALIYKTLVLTGLRKNELASVTVGALELDGPVCCAVLDPAKEKNRQGARIPLRPDLSSDLREWLRTKLAVLQENTRRAGRDAPVTLPAQTPLFNVPSSLLRVLDRDLKAAGIPKQDDRGRTVDLHAMRTTFGTHLSKGGVPLRTAQAAMWHSDPRLTANVYTDPRLLDIAGALEALPELPLGNGDDGESGTEQATTDVGDVAPSVALSVAPNVAPTLAHSRPTESLPDKTAVSQGTASPSTRSDVTVGSDNRKPSLTTTVSEGHMVGVIGFEPTASCSQSREEQFRKFLM